jgi:hypothetical protein
VIHMSDEYDTAPRGRRGGGEQGGGEGKEEEEVERSKRSGVMHAYERKSMVSHRPGPGESQQASDERR